MIKVLPYFILLFISSLCQQKIIYLYNNNHQFPQSLDTKGFLIDPEYISINCDIKDCSRYKVSELPAMIYWGGAGFAFQKIQPPTQQKMRQHLKMKQTGPLNILKMWIQSLSDLETTIFAFSVCTFLYFVFTFLFSPKQKKQKPQ